MKLNKYIQDLNDQGDIDIGVKSLPNDQLGIYQYLFPKHSQGPLVHPLHLIHQITNGTK